MHRPSIKVLEQKESAEEELLMKGPGTFPLERLLAIFQCIVSVAEDPSDEEDQRNDGLGIQGGNSGLMSDILLQLSSLCKTNFIIRGGSCPIEGLTRYRTTISEDVALKVAFISTILPLSSVFIVYLRRHYLLKLRTIPLLITPKHPNVAAQVARSLEFPLSKYLYRR